MKLLNEDILHYRSPDLTKGNKMEINEMFESMDIEKEQKVALQEAFETAVIKKTTEMLDEHVETLLAEKVEVLEEEYAEKVEGLTESLDGYLDTVVEEFVAENAPSYEAQIADEKSTTLLELFDKMVKVVGVDMLTINEAKDTKEQDEFNESAEAQVTVLEDKVATMADRLVEAKRESDKYLKAGIVAELSEGLTILESAKFSKLAELVAFDRNAAYLDKLDTIKESILSSRSEDFQEPDAVLPQNAFKQPEKVDVASAMDFSKYL